MKRVLRITASAFFGLVTVALIVLWVRSFTSYDYAQLPVGNNNVYSASTLPGGIIFRISRLPNHWRPPKDRSLWNLGSGPVVPGDLRKRQFRLRTETPSTSELVLPLWFFSAITAALAAAPWLPYANRYRLRTLLISTTLFAIALGLICYSNRCGTQP